MSMGRLPFNCSSDESTREIEGTASRLLAEVGIKLDHARATDMLHGLGCRVEKGRVFITEEVQEWTRAHITPHTVFRRANGEPAFTLGDGEVRFHNSGSIPYIYDLGDHARRATTLDDVAAASIVLDGLPNVDIVLPLFAPHELRTEIISLAATSVVLKHCRKPVTPAPAESPEEVGFITAMAAACCGGMESFRQAPTMPIMVSPVTPLTFPEKIAGAILAVAEAGAPFHPLPAPSLGATGPVTLAGSLALQHAEALACYTLAAAASPGVPVLYCSRINPIDVRTAISSWGGPEVGMSGAGARPLARRLGLRCDSYGFSTSSSRLDPQLAFEKYGNALVPALAGVDLISGVGSAESNLVGGLEIAVIDNEMAGMIKRVVRGSQVTHETLAFEEMKEVIMGDGVFLAEQHTARHIRAGALWVPEISDRTGGTQEASPAESLAGIVARARDKAAGILRDYSGIPWPDSVLRELDEILVDAHAALIKER